jgi:hypothetical protein
MIGHPWDLGVAEYRAYIIGDDGRFIGFEPLACRDDADAITQGRRMVDCRDVEIWNRERFVIRLCHEEKKHAF